MATLHDSVWQQTPAQLDKSEEFCASKYCPADRLSVMTFEHEYFASHQDNEFLTSRCVIIENKWIKIKTLAAFDVLQFRTSSRANENED